MIGDAKRLQPFDPDERRDALLAWGGLVGAMGSIACLILPMPWGALAAAFVVAVTVLALRRVHKPPRSGATVAR